MHVLNIRGETLEERLNKAPKATPAQPMATCMDDAHGSCNKEVIYKSGKSDTRTYILLTARASSRVCRYRRMQGEQLAKATRDRGELVVFVGS